MWYKGKEYYSINKWVGIFNENYKDKGVRVNAHDLHQLFGYYKIPKLKINGKGEVTENGRRILYPVNLVNQVRTMKEDFMYVLTNIVNYGVSNGQEYYNPYKEQVVAEPTYNDNENDMENHSNNLIDKYQFEGKKTIKLTESQYKRLFEGATYTNNDGKIDFSINTKQSDLDNKNIDTRIFGTKNDILYGDGTLDNRFKTFNDSYVDNISLIKFYRSLIDYVNNDFNGNLDFSVLRNDVALKIQNLIKKGDKQSLLDMASSTLNRLVTNNLMDRNLYHRTNALQNDNDKIERYRLGTVPGTNVNVISLFTMDDFNFSDAIKHGELRQNGNTDEILGIDKKDRKKIPAYGKRGASSLEKLPITYDNGKIPDIKSNFSLDNLDDNTHFKKSYKGNGDYTSINQFLDKSIIYAKHALVKENFIPDYIVAAPSSSKFNHYYCINLSRKIGSQYITNFFKRNLINVKFDESVEREMINDGIGEEERFMLENRIRDVSLQEVSYNVSQPIELFFKQYNNIFSTISLKKMSREKCDIELIKDIFCKLVINSLIETSSYERSDNIYKTIVKVIYNNISNLKASDNFDINHISNEIINRITLKVGKGVLANLIKEVDKLILYYNNQFNSGYKLNLRSKRFKITDFDKRYRKYLKNVYIISDDYLNKDNELYTRYKNAKFLIFDEDINSGATLKLVIDALKMKIDNSDNNLMCLVNAYSNSGR